MVLLVGLAPGHQTSQLYCTSTKQNCEDLWINKISFDDEEKVDEMFQNLKINITKKFGKNHELGMLCVYLGSNFDYSYGNAIREKFILSGLSVGFKAVEIIDLFAAMFFDALRQSNFKPEENDVIWIHNYGTWFIWKKLNDQCELIHCDKRGDTWVTEELMEKYEQISGKQPDVVIYGHAVRDYLVSFFSSRYQLFVFENFYYASGALVKARIMAGKSKFLCMDAKNVLGRELKIKVGKKKVLQLRPHQTVPYEKVFKIKKNESDAALKISDGSSKEEMQLPSSNTCLLLIQIDTNGIYKIKIPATTMITMNDKNVEIFNVGTQSTITFPATADNNFNPPKVGCQYKLNAVSSGFITKFDKKGIQLILEKCLQKIGANNEQVFIVLPDAWSCGQREPCQRIKEIAALAGFTNLAVIDETTATVFKQNNYEEVICVVEN